MVLLAATLCASCGGKVKTDREQLYELLVSDELHERHQCRDVLPPIYADQPEEVKSMIWQLLEHAELDEITECLHNVQEYNSCYAALDCSELTEDTYPAWAGIGTIPCSCGEVVDSVLVPSLPEPLENCWWLLPISLVLGGPPSCNK
jgi:hypothetical protein